MGYNVAVVGATGNVGREMLAILAERRFPADEVVALASRRSQGVEVSFGDRTLKVKALEHYDFSDTDICLMSAGGAVSKEWSPKIAAAGRVVIDNSSAWRYDPDVPLIVPEVNADAIAGFRRQEHHRQPELLDRAARRRAEAAARPRHDQARGGRHLPVGLRRRQGRHGRAVHPDQGGLHAPARSRPKKFPKRIAFNLIPQIDVFMEDGYTTRRMEDGGRDQEDPRPEDQARRHLRARAGVHRPFRGGQHRVRESDHRRRGARDPAQAPGCIVIDKHEPGGYVTPYESAGEDATYISRIREDATVENGLAMWVVSDNLRKGAALNAIQIAEVLISAQADHGEAEGGVGRLH